MTLYIKIRMFVMKRLIAPLLLAAAMIAIGVMARFDIVSDSLARMSPFLLLALFPYAWLGSKRGCRNAPQRGA